MPKKFYIIDNEADTISRIRILLKDFPEYSFIGASDVYEESMNAILKHSPRIVFANIDFSMPETSIFNFANELYQYKNTIPTFVAISSFKDKAYSVLKSSFFDLLLKPLSEFELRKTILKFNKKQELEAPSTLCLKSYKDYRFVNTDEILYLQADNNSTDLFMSDGRKVSGYQTLKHFETLLPDNFIRIHHSYIINIDHVTRIHFGKSKCALKQTDQHIPFSRSYKSNVELLKESLAKSAIIAMN